MAAKADPRIPVSAEVRKQLRILKAKQELRSYDELLRKMSEDYSPDGE